MDAPPPRGDTNPTPDGMWTKEYVGTIYVDPPEERITSEDLTRSEMIELNRQQRFTDIPICDEHHPELQIGKCTRSHALKNGTTFAYMRFKTNDDNARMKVEGIQKGWIKGLSLSHGAWSKQPKEISLVIYPKRQGTFLVEAGKNTCAPSSMNGGENTSANGNIANNEK